jgi:hypothetical protein
MRHGMPVLCGRRLLGGIMDGFRGATLVLVVTGGQ